MRVFVTGATGFIGGEVARRLRARGDEVVALVRTPSKASALHELGVELAAGDLSDRDAIARAVAGCDAVIHAAAVYEVGIPAKDRPAMYDANVEGTRRVLEAALAAKVSSAVYVSTCAVFGNTRGEVVDETYRHPRTSYTSYYEETKVLAHDVAEEIAGRGLPLVIVQPGGVYGPGDPSVLGDTVQRVAKGKLPLLPFPDLGMTMVHRDDVADGILLALEKGRAGESYVLGGETLRARELAARVAAVAGKKPPRGAMPTGLIKACIPFGRVLGPLMGFPPNFRELVTSADGVTFWARADKATSELGWTSRSLDEGFAAVVAALD